MREGLGRAMLVPVGTYWADIYGGVSKVDGPFAQAEAGWHAWQHVGVYGFGQVSQRDAMAGVGIHFEW